MSESAFAHLFKKCTSTSPYQFLKQLRFEHARDLLLENHTVSEAARRVGYSSLSHFISEFKRYFGETPRSYLRRLGGLESFNLHADVDQLAGPRLPASARRRALPVDGSGQRPCR